MTKSTLAGLALSLLLPLAVSATVAADNQQAGQRYISVQGTGVVATAPDSFNFALTVEERGQTVSKLNDLVERKTAQIITFLLDSGVASDDIQSLQVSLYPWYNHQAGKREQQGMILSRQIRVTVRNMQSFDRILDGTLRLGAGRFGGVGYGLNDPRAVYLSSLELALQDARARAQKIASTLGVTVGEVISVSEQSRYQPRPMAAEMARMADSPASLPGLMETRADVAVKFAIHAGK